MCRNIDFFAAHGAPDNDRRSTDRGLLASTAFVQSLRGYPLALTRQERAQLLRDARDAMNEDLGRGGSNGRDAATGRPSCSSLATAASSKDDVVAAEEAAVKAAKVAETAGGEAEAATQAAADADAAAAKAVEALAAAVTADPPDAAGLERAKVVDRRAAEAARSAHGAAGEARAKAEEATAAAAAAAAVVVAAQSAHDSAVAERRVIAKAGREELGRRPAHSSTGYTHTATQARRADAEDGGWLHLEEDLRRRMGMLSGDLDWTPAQLHIEWAPETRPSMSSHVKRLRARQRKSLDGMSAADIGARTEAEKAEKAEKAERARQSQRRSESGGSGGAQKAALGFTGNSRGLFDEFQPALASAAVQLDGLDNRRRIPADGITTDEYDRWAAKLPPPHTFTSIGWVQQWAEKQRSQMPVGHAARQSFGEAVRKAGADAREAAAKAEAAARSGGDDGDGGGGDITGRSTDSTFASGPLTPTVLSILHENAARLATARLAAARMVKAAAAGGSGGGYDERSSPSADKARRDAARKAYWSPRDRNSSQNGLHGGLSSAGGRGSAAAAEALALLSAASTPRDGSEPHALSKDGLERLKAERVGRKLARELSARDSERSARESARESARQAETAAAQLAPPQAVDDTPICTRDTPISDTPIRSMPTRHTPTRDTTTLDTTTRSSPPEAFTDAKEDSGAHGHAPPRKDQALSMDMPPIAPASLAITTPSSPDTKAAPTPPTVTSPPEPTPVVASPPELTPVVASPPELTPIAAPLLATQPLSPTPLIPNAPAMTTQPTLLPSSLTSASPPRPQQTSPSPPSPPKPTPAASPPSSPPKPTSSASPPKSQPMSSPPRPSPPRAQSAAVSLPHSGSLASNEDWRAGPVQLTDSVFDAGNGMDPG